MANITPRREKDAVGEELKGAAKGKAKNVAKKAAKKVAKKVKKQIQDKIAARVVVSASSGPSGCGFILAIIILIILPAVIFASVFGWDSNNGEVPGGVGTSWYDDEAAAMNAAQAALETNAWWSDLGNWFTGNGWGNRGETFRNDLANAADTVKLGEYEEENEDYFSSSNRLVAIVNEALRQGALRGSSTLGQARNMANNAETLEQRRQKIADQNGVPIEQVFVSGTYTLEGGAVIDLIVQRDTSEQNYRNEAVYIIAAASYDRFQSEEDGEDPSTDDFQVSSRKTLEAAFYLSGADSGGLFSYSGGTIWVPKTQELAVQSEERVEGTGEYEYFWLLPDGGETTNVDDAALDEDGEPIPIFDENGDQKSEEIKETKIYYYQVVEYFVAMKPKTEFETEVHTYCNVPMGDTQQDKDSRQMVTSSAKELLRFYRGSAVYRDIEGDWALPVEAGKWNINSPFGSFEWLRTVPHRGIDLPVPVGTNVYAAGAGTVTAADFMTGYGLVVFIDHGNGVETRYAHLSEIWVSVGDEATTATGLGLSGNTGDSSGPHLHFELRVDGEPQDPLEYGELGTVIRDGVTSVAPVFVRD